MGWRVTSLFIYPTKLNTVVVSVAFFVEFPFPRFSQKGDEEDLFFGIHRASFINLGYQEYEKEATAGMTGGATSFTC